MKCAVLTNETKRKADPIAEVVAGRQHVDWRDLRFEPFTSPDVGRMLAKMAEQIADAMEREFVAEPVSPEKGKPVSTRRVV